MLTKYTLAMPTRATASTTVAEQVADRLHSAAIRLLRRLRIEDSASGIGPARLSALSVLVFAGPMTLGELAAAEQVKPPTMTRIVQGLEKQGLARREPAADDARSIRVHATAKGTRLLDAGRRRRTRLLSTQLETLTPAELRNLADAAESLHRLIPKL